MSDEKSGEEMYGEAYKESNEPIFSGIPTFLKLPEVERDALDEKPDDRT